jgi:hypothetical protein
MKKSLPTPVKQHIHKHRTSVAPMNQVVVDDEDKMVENEEELERRLTLPTPVKTAIHKNRKSYVIFNAAPQTSQEDNATASSQTVDQEEPKTPAIKSESNVQCPSSVAVEVDATETLDDESFPDQRKKRGRALWAPLNKSSTTARGKAPSTRLRKGAKVAAATDSADELSTCSSLIEPEHEAAMATPTKGLAPISVEHDAPAAHRTVSLHVAVLHDVSAHSVVRT